MNWWLVFEKKPFQFRQKIWIQVVVILLQLYSLQYARSNSKEIMKNSFIIFGPKLLKSSMVLPGFCKPTLNSVLCTGWREKNCAKIAEICLPRLSIEKLDSFFMNSNCGKETKLLFFCNKEQQNTYLHHYEKIHF